MKIVFMATILTLTAAVAQGSHSGFKCNGTEPFWSLTTDSKVISFHSPELKEDFRITHTLENPLRIFAVSDSKRKIEVKIRPQKCIDDSKGDSYNFSVKILLNGFELQGCCKL